LCVRVSDGLQLGRAAGADKRRPAIHAQDLTGDETGLFGHATSIDHWRLDRPREDAIDADALGTVVDRHRLG
jgi:hypothetical protein